MMILYLRPFVKGRRSVAELVTIQVVSQWYRTMIKQEFLRLARMYPVAAALKSTDDMAVALSSDAALLFILKGDAFQLASFLSQAHRRGKGVVVHVDLVSGIGKDPLALNFCVRSVWMPLSPVART